MAGEGIRTNLPGIHTFLTENSLQPNFLAQIEVDLSELGWLNKSQLDDESFIKALLSILDRSGVSTLKAEEYFDIFSLSRVKIFVYDYFYQLIAKKEKLKEICGNIKSLTTKMSLFKEFSNYIENIQDSELSIHFKHANSSYKAFRIDYVAIFQQMEKCIQTEYSKAIGSFLDEVYYAESLKPNKEKLKKDIDSHHQLRIYKTSQYQTTKYSYYAVTKYDDIYVGETEGNLRHGYGKLYYSNRSIYEGFWKNDKKNGKGMFMWKDGSKYCGEFKAGQFHGRGRRIYSNGSYYDGEFEKGKKNGKGFMKFRNGDTYEGEWDDDDMHGKGVYRWVTGDVFVGNFKRDKRSGEGVLTMVNGEVVSGCWENGMQKKDEVKDTNEI